MSNEKKADGGAAFPAMGERNTPDGKAYVWNEGMSLRDHFAGLAMQGMAPFTWRGANTYDELSRKSYAMADAMLRAREQ